MQLARIIILLPGSIIYLLALAKYKDERPMSAAAHSPQGCPAAAAPGAALCHQLYRVLYEECRFAKQADSSGWLCPWKVLIFCTQRCGTAKPGLRDEERGDYCRWYQRSDPGGFHLEVLFDH